MLQNFSEENTIFYLIDVTETDGELFASPLAKQWNSSAFMKDSTAEQAHKFSDKDSAKKMANIQNMMNEAFGSESRVYVVEDVTVSKIYDVNGELVDKDSFVVTEDAS